jgi:hypothetical protein
MYRCYSCDLYLWIDSFSFSHMLSSLLIVRYSTERNAEAPDARMRL